MLALLNKFDFRTVILLGQGMAAIFVVIFAIMGVVYLLNYATNKKTTKKSK
jgi:hypothetical protein